MSTGKLVAPTFETGPNEELAVVDVYKGGGGGVVNSFQEKDAEAVEAASKANESSPDEMGGEDKGMDDNSDDPLGDFMESLEKGEGAPTEESLMDSFGDFGAPGEATGLFDDIMSSFSDIAGGDMSAVMDAVSGMVDSNEKWLNPFPEDMLDSRYRLVDITKDLANGSGQLLSAISDLPAEMSRYLPAGFDLEQIKGQVFATVGDTLTQITSGFSLDAIGPVANILSNISNGTYNATIQSAGGLAALVSGTSMLANKMNMPGVFSTLSQSITNPNIIMAAAKPLLQAAVYQGDMGLFKDIARSSVAGSVTSLVPTAIGSMTSVLRKPSELAQQEYPRYYQGMRSAYDAVDPSWSTYSREGGDLVNTAIISGNNFVTDLIRSQLNEVMHPNNYLSNVQQVYPESGVYDKSFVPAQVSVMTQDALIGVALDSTNVVPDESFDYEVNAGTPSLAATTAAQEVLRNTPTQITNFDNEPFLLFSQVYRKNSVQEELNRYFPEFAATMTTEAEVMMF